MFDTHCHLTFPQFAGRTTEILDAAEAVGVRGAITISTTTRDCLEALRLAESDPRLWCTAGIHPLHSDEPIEWENLRRVAAHPRCVAWGELGLDNHYDRPPTATQHQVLETQLERIQGWTAEGLSKPIVLHCREAFDDLIPILESAPFPRERYVFHCFTGDTSDVRKVLDFGAHVSFTGVVTFGNARAVADAAKLVPADRLLVETDAPFLSPEPVRTTRPNEPANVAHIHRFLATLRGEPLTDFVKQVDANVEAFFRIHPTGTRLSSPSVNA